MNDCYYCADDKCYCYHILEEEGLGLCSRADRVSSPCKSRRLAEGFDMHHSPKQKLNQAAFQFPSEEVPVVFWMWQKKSGGSRETRGP